MTAAPYVELNPVRARLVERPELWEFNSASAHVHRTEDRLVKLSLLNEKIPDWKDFLSLAPSEEKIKMLQQHERTGRPLGGESFLTRLEKSLGRFLKPKKAGRKPKKTNK